MVRSFLLPAAALLLGVVLASAARAEPSDSHPLRLVDVGLELGLNTPGGWGLGASVRPLPKAAIVGSAGAGAAGLLGALGARWYFSESNDSGFLGGAFSFSSGTPPEVPMELTVKHADGRTETGRYRLLPAKMLDLVLGYRFGFGGDRGLIQLYAGWSFVLSGGRFEPLGQGVELDEAGRLALDLAEPGGLVLGFGIGFGL